MIFVEQNEYDWFPDMKSNIRCICNRYVALVGANMTATSIVIFSVLRGFSQATGAVMQAIFSEEFNDEEVRDIHQQNVACSSFFFALQVLAGFAIFVRK